jgi:NADH-quinone oxidoreductase subunit N
MSGHAMLLLSPWLILAGALLVLLVGVGFRRRHAEVAAFTLVALSGTALAALILAAGPLPDTASLASPLVVVDGLALLLAALFAFTGALVAVLGWRYLEGRGGAPEEFHLLLLCAVFGAMTLAAADHFAAVVLGLEILSISLYAMIAYPEEGDWPLEAGLKYLILSGVASSTLLFGVALLYARTGSLGFEAMTGAAVVPADDPLVRVGAVMVLAAIAFKLSLAPFHFWTPDVYQGAPAPVSGLVATLSKGAVVVVLLRIVLAGGILASAPLLTMLAALAVLSMLVGNLLALLQRSVKRVLAFSSVAHMGYLMVALIAVGRVGGTALGVEAAVAYLFAYTFMTLAAFAVIGLLARAGDARDPDDIDAFTGLLWRRPLAASVLGVALLSLAGIPLTVGFLAKFYLVAAGVEQGLWLLLAVLVVGSGLGLYYYLRILFAMTRPLPAVPVPTAPVGLTGGWVLVILVGLMVLPGLWPAPFIAMIRGVLAMQ